MFSGYENIIYEKVVLSKQKIMRKNYYPSIEETYKIYKFKQLNSVKNIEDMQKIAIKVDDP